MSAVEPSWTPSGKISLNHVRDFRQRGSENGYPLIRVHSRSKRPCALKWPCGESPEALSDVGPEAVNTGLVLGRFRCIDCDIDDPQVASEIMRAAQLHLPPGALIRYRANSSRVALLYRAAEGQPSKRMAKGPKGKVEILGLGQQVVVHGLHTSGAAIRWQNGRGPDTVPHDQIPDVSEPQITAFLNACAPLLGATISEPGVTGASLCCASVSGFVLPGTALPPEFAKLSDRFKEVPVENELGAGIEPHNWYGALPPEEKSAVLEACLNALDNRTTDERPFWLRVLFAVAHAERLGCPDARQLALKWSRRGASWTTEADFETAWASYKPKPGGITVGSLLATAANAGLDLSRWRDAALTQLCGAPPGAAQDAAGPTESQAASVPALPPDKRKPLKGGVYSRDEGLALLNSHYLIGTTDRETGIFRIGDDGSLTFIPPEQFKLEVANIFVQSSGTGRPISAEKYWKEHPHRHQRKIVFKPGGATEADEFNLWQGFGVVPRKTRRKMRSLLRHIWRVLCRRDKEKFTYLIRWLAWTAQNPDKNPGVVIVLKSRAQGTGKTTLGVVLLRIFGPHGALIDDKERLLGRFNDWLEPVCFILAEEILWAGDLKTGDKLKSVSTADTIQVERKFGGCRPIPNRLHIIMTTNHDHAVAAGVGDRRFVVLDVSNERAGDKKYFDRLYRDLDEGGTGEFLDFLQNVDLDGWHPRKLIKTAEATEQQRMSGDSVSHWSQASINDDAIGNYNLETRISTKKLRESYTEYCKQHGLRAVSEEAFGKACTEMFGPRQRLTAVQGSTHRPWGYDVPNGDTWQERINVYLGIKK